MKSVLIDVKRRFNIQVSQLYDTEVRKTSRKIVNHINRQLARPITIQTAKGWHPVWSLLREIG